MKRFLLGLLVGIVLCGLALVIAFFVAVRVSARPPSIPSDAILALTVEGDIPESPPIEVPLPLFQQARPATVRENWELLRKAAADSRIRAVVFMPQNLTVGWAKLQELRNNLLAFRKSGKPLYAFLRAPGAREYYVAAAAERIYMPPEDFLNLKGLRAELIFVRNTLDKIGVRVEVETAGQYKDFPEMVTRTSASPESRRVMNAILDDLYGQLTAAIGEARKKTPEEVRATIDRGPFTSPQALAAGLVDGLYYQDQVFGELQRRLKLPEIRRVSRPDYMRVPPQSVGVEKGSRVAFVVASGDIVRGGEAMPPLGDFLSLSQFTRLLRRVGSDRGIRGVIVRIDSPGGDGFASDEIWREMMLLSKKKPVVISMSDVAASGGYYIAMTGDPLIAYPGTYTGSIGVFYGKADLRGLYGKLGIQKELFLRGRFADIDSDYTPLSPEGREKLRDNIQAFYRSFVQRVAEARRKPYEQIQPVAEGRVWLGSQAQTNGLVDSLGGIERAIELLKKKAGIPESDDIRLISYPPPRTLWEQVFNPGASEPLLDSPDLRRLVRFASSTWAKGGMFKLMPYWIEVK
ncbi:MAG: signal peptide peptidase SppA [Rhodospirillales bacterium]